MEQKTFYYLYEIRNNLNGKIYVGVHKTKDLTDGYMGSGKLINSAIQKYGVENFTRTILETFENAEAMYAREKEVVTDAFLARDDTYNLRRGGYGGFDFINQDPSLQNNRSIEGSKRGGNSSRDKEKGIHSPEIRSQNKTRNVDQSFGFCSPTAVDIIRRGCQAAKSEAAIAKRKETYSKIGHSKGNKNSQYGSVWITNEKENKKISACALVPDGWRKGRVIKF